jgi:hypothetical protein
MTEPAAVMRLAAGHYWTAGGYEIFHDDGEAGSGDWVVCRRGPGGHDNPLAFCRTLNEARAFIADSLRPGAVAV